MPMLMISVTERELARLNAIAERRRSPEHPLHCDETLPEHVASAMITVWLNGEEHQEKRYQERIDDQARAKALTVR